MTKQKMIEEIQAKEAQLWLELAEHENMFAPADGNYDRQIEWDTTDPEHQRRLAAWNAVNELLEALGVEADSDSVEHRVARGLHHDLFIRRQAARGVFYDKRGNEI